MNTVSRKPTIDDTFKFIWHDYHCPNTDTNRKTDWMPSQDIKDQQPLLFMELAEKFVESVAKSDVLPFDFNKSMYGTILRKSPWGTILRAVKTAESNRSKSRRS